MNKIPFAAAIGMTFYIFSCGTPAAPASTITQAETNLNNLHKLHRAIATGNLSVLDTIVSENYIDHLPGQDNVGRDNMKKYLQQIHDNLPDFKDSILAESASDNWIFFLARITGTTTTPMMGLPAHSKLDKKAVRIIKVEKGIFMETWVYVDPKDMIPAQNLPDTAHPRQPS